VSIFENSTTDGCLVCDDKNVACWESGGRDCFINSPTTEIDESPEHEIGETEAEIVSNPNIEIGEIVLSPKTKIDEAEFDVILLLVLTSFVVFAFCFVVSFAIAFSCRSQNQNENSKISNDKKSKLKSLQCSGELPKPIFVISNV
jgi:hypothetical protein